MLQIIDLMKLRDDRQRDVKALQEEIKTLKERIEKLENPKPPEVKA
jgi:polyhydroxyalkanoate synthesis regulator phasin